MRKGGEGEVVGQCPCYGDGLERLRHDVASAKPRATPKQS